MVRWLKRFLRRLGFTGLALIMVPLLVTVMWLRFFGLPEQMKERLIQELAQRGLIVEVERLLLDPSGGVLAQKLTVYRNADRDQVWVQLDRARIGFAWLSWWQGRSFIDSVSVANATVSLPITPHAAMTLEHVNAAVDFIGKELVVRGAEARWHHIEFEALGRIHINGLPPRAVMTPEQMESLEKIWATVESYAGQVGGEKPMGLHVEFDLPTKEPQLGKADFALIAKGTRFRDALIEEFSLTGHMAEGEITLDDLRIKLARGEFGAQGVWNLQSRRAELEFSSNLDFTPLATAFEGRTRTVLSSLNFGELPLMTGRATLDWSTELAVNVQTDLDWRDFSYSNVRFTRLVIPLGYDGHRLLIPQAEVVNATGALTVDGYVDQTKPEVKIKINSTLDPTALTGLFGDKADRFLSSCQFNEAGPSLQAVINGTSLNPSEWAMTGALKSKNFAYKQVSLEEVSLDFVLQNQQIQTGNLYVKRKEGKLNGEVRFDFKERWVEMKNLTSSLAAREAAPILGPKFVSYMSPYRFSAPGSVKVNGKVDLVPAKLKPDTNLSIEVDGTGMTMGFDLFHRPIEIKNPKGAITVVERDLKVQVKSSDFYEGKLDGVVLFNLTPGQPDFQTFLNLNRNNFQQVATALFGFKDASGILTSQAQFKGQFGRMETMTGNGKMVVEEGNIMSIPILGGLTKLLNEVIPNFGFTTARNARCTYILKEGKVQSTDVEITSPTFSVIGDGDHDFVNDNLNFNVRVNIRGIMGVVFFPVSKLFEYHGSGSLKSPKWEPKNFSGGPSLPRWEQPGERGVTVGKLALLGDDSRVRP